MPKIKVNDIEIYYEIKGEGSPLFFISGSFGDLRRTPNVFDSPLMDHFKILAYDQRGLGRTSKPDKPYSMADYAEDAACLLDTLRLDKVPVMGVSFGGMVAQELAIRYPEKVERLVIACSSTGGKGGASYPIHELDPDSPYELAEKWIGVLDNRVNDSWRLENPEEYDERIRDFVKWVEEIYGEGGSEKRMGVFRQLEARRHHDTYSRVHRIQALTFICGGKYDGQAPPENLENIHSLMPNSRLEFFEGGHGFLSQDPRAYNVIIDFLKGG
jgi:3-oxoadipate enol-lactonase